MILLDAIPTEVQRALEDLNVSIQLDNRNEEIVGLLENSTLLGGKRLRPLLTFLMGGLFSVDPAKMMPFSRAIEMVHAASLAHDDVIDRAKMRRGRASINELAGNKRAILAGDYLLASVIVDVCKEGNLEILSELSHVIKDLADGEWLQMDNAVKRHPTLEDIQSAAEKKTASVMSWCSLVAPLLNKQNDLVESCRAFGRHLGIAFQMVDDALDWSNQSETGKDQNLDWTNGVMNFVLYRYVFLTDASAWDLRGIPLQKFDQEKLKTAVKDVKSMASNHLICAREKLSEIYQNLPRSSERELYYESLLQILSFLELRGH